MVVRIILSSFWNPIGRKRKLGAAFKIPTVAMTTLKIALNTTTALAFQQLSQTKTKHVCIYEFQFYWIYILCTCNDTNQT
jgi:hypothetical protein